MIIQVVFFRRDIYEKTMKRMLAIMLVVVMTIGAIQLSGFVGLESPEFVAKADAATSGTCGENLAYSFDTNTGILKISGTDKMTNWTYSSQAFVQSVS